MATTIVSSALALDFFSALRSSSWSQQWLVSALLMEQQSIVRRM
jgi:hypothetical protein